MTTPRQWQEFEFRRVDGGEVVGHIRTAKPMRPGELVVSFRNVEFVVEPLENVPQPPPAPEIGKGKGKARR